LKKITRDTGRPKNQWTREWLYTYVGHRFGDVGCGLWAVASNEKINNV
jgi:hypothetical protein